MAARGSRALATVTAAVILVVVVIVAGAVVYVLGQSFHPGATTVTSCAPPSSSACRLLSDVHDVSVLAPFRTVQVGTAVPLTALLAPGESASSFTFNFGDGRNVTGTSPTVDHAYTSPGSYLVFVQATVHGSPHDNLHSLVAIQVDQSSASSTAGDVPTVVGVSTANSTSSVRPTGVLSPGQFLSVSASYTSAPTNPSWAEIAPKIVAPGASATKGNSTASSASAQATYSRAGIYTLSFVGGAQSSGTTQYQNYTWTVFVSSIPAGVSGASVRSSPHPGKIVSYELQPGGAFSLDPAIDYEVVGYEPIMNVYQTLVFYNQSQVGPYANNYVPDLATCVPGTSQCTKLYGNSLLSANGTDYTFVISSASSFYDPATGAHWGVYPSDVVFSLARTMGFADYPAVSINPGWIQAQSLLPNGTAGWDGGLHAPYNNTPQGILGSMLVNDSTFCPHPAMVIDHGCVTFVVHGGGVSWPYFFELIGDPLGASIVPCGWFSAPAHGNGIPYWTLGNVTGSGDHPCGMPGTPGYGLAPASIPPTGWDGWERAGAASPYLGDVQHDAVGSGPYYLAAYSIGASYDLKANPYYGSNPHCTWAGCLPPKGSFASEVFNTWETSAAQGEQAYASGTADFASIPSTDAGLAIQLLQQGKIGAASVPEINTNEYGFDFNTSVADTAKYTSSPVTIPSNFFDYVGLRQFFVHAWPYATVQSSVNTVDGIQYGFNIGGAIPQFMGNYYPTNISWPSGDPCTSTTNPNCAGYWWSQATTAGTPYYDPELAKCTASAPCQFPMFSFTGAPNLDDMLTFFGHSVSQLTGGRIQVSIADITATELFSVLGTYAPGTNPMPFSAQIWYADYADPVDFVGPYYYPDATYTYNMALAETMAQPAWNATASCPSSSDPMAYVHGPVGNTCQGPAYLAMLSLFYRAAHDSNPGERVLLYNLGEQIANKLAIHIDAYQGSTVSTYSTWIDASAVADDNMIFVGDYPWWTITGNSVQHPGST
jgi:peptide/nickel transport system substrate-binding protein